MVVAEKGDVVQQQLRFKRQAAPGPCALPRGRGVRKAHVTVSDLPPAVPGRQDYALHWVGAAIFGTKNRETMEDVGTNLSPLFSRRQRDPKPDLGIVVLSLIRLMALSSPF